MLRGRGRNGGLLHDGPSVQPAGLEPLIDRAFGIGGRGQMMGQQFGLALDKIGEMTLQHSRDTSVQFLPPSAQ